MIVCVPWWSHDAHVINIVGVNLMQNIPVPSYMANVRNDSWNDLYIYLMNITHWQIVSTSSIIILGAPAGEIQLIIRANKWYIILITTEDAGKQI